MINANELRLGNLLQNSGSLMKVVSLDIRYKNPSCVVVEKLKGQHTNEFRHYPIPITEEWLLRMGFEKEPKNSYWTLFLSQKDESEFGRQRIDFWFGQDDFQAAELCRSGVCFKRVKIRHVHTLQNLYFALTGEELEIKD